MVMHNWSGVHMLPLSTKHILKYEKKIEQKFHAYIPTFYVSTTKFRGKPIFLVLCVTKTCHV
jgi:hypothetical protein